MFANFKSRYNLTEMKKAFRKYIILSFLFLLVGIQFFGIDKSVPPTDPAKDFFVVLNPPRRIISMLRSSCYDCHSYKTIYPWYSNIAPVSWILKSHIEEGREHLNFSEFGNYPREKRNQLIFEIREVIEKQEMPMRSYTLFHEKARIDEGMKELIVSWLTEGKNAVYTP